MLPRITKVDMRMEQLFQDLVFRYSHTLDPLFADIETYTIHEGRATRMKHGGDEWVDKMNEASAEVAIKHEELEKFNLNSFLALAKEVGTKFLEAKTRNLFDTLHEATERVGNVVDNAGRPLDHDAMFKVLETIQIDFDENGRPELPTVVISPAMAPRLVMLNKQFQETPDLQKRYANLINRKKEEFLEREASRKLVG